MRIGIGILLIIAAVAFLLFSLIPAITDDNQTVLNIFESIYCASGEELSSTREVGPSADGGIGMTAFYTCTRADESTYDATGKSWLITGIGFTVLLLLGIGLIVSGSRSQEIDPSSAYPVPAVQTPTTRYTTVTYGDAPPSSDYPFSTAEVPAAAPDDLFNLPLNSQPTAPTTASASNIDLQEKLRQLEEAYDHHLINREEYERKRDEILKEF